MNHGIKLAFKNLSARPLHNPISEPSPVLGLPFHKGSVTGVPIVISFFLTMVTLVLGGGGLLGKIKHGPGLLTALMCASFEGHAAAIEALVQSRAGVQAASIPRRDVPSGKEPGALPACQRTSSGAGTPPSPRKSLELGTQHIPASQTFSGAEMEFSSLQHM